METNGTRMIERFWKLRHTRSSITGISEPPHTKNSFYVNEFDDKQAAWFNCSTNTVNAVLYSVLFVGSIRQFYSSVRRCCCILVCCTFEHKHNILHLEPSPLCHPQLKGLHLFTFFSLPLLSTFRIFSLAL